MQAFKTEPVHSKGVQEWQQNITNQNFQHQTMLNPEHSPQQDFWKVSWEVTPALAAVARTNEQELAQHRSPTSDQMHYCQSSHTSGRGDTYLICAIHDPQKVLAGLEDLREECGVRGTRVKQGQVERLGSLRKAAAETPGSSRGAIKDKMWQTGLTVGEEPKGKEGSDLGTCFPVRSDPVLTPLPGLLYV